jgi:hypothetical protein
MTRFVAIIILLYCSEQLHSQLINPLVIKRGSIGSCASLEETEATIESLRTSIKQSLLTVTVTECGDGMWHSLASIDMTNLQQQCPTGWREFNQSTIRACGRPVTNPPSCASISYSTVRRYSKVCGRVIGYQLGNAHGVFTNRSIGQSYVDGVSITYRSSRFPRQHIWTYIAALTENGTASRRRNCPCSDSSGRPTPNFVNSSYYCESANPTDVLENPGFLYTSDKLWDGQQCNNEGDCCISEQLPWFNVTLPNPVSNDIEIRICGNDRSNESDTLVELLDIYIQ